ncbi:MAG: DUF2817 domain-containing protein [Pseudobdellovibrionaceae bacterium]|nr:DUF2817 domain-containing protein [Bdellovibrionales bacterium]USN47261.1 MAG: DUF2817 domain-containing protein [Pseudobdellovibrionaceae bacterium]
MKIFANPQWATSNDGKPIALYSSFDLGSKTPEAPVVVVGGVHGDEPEGVYLVDGLLSWLRSLNQPTPVSWIIIPCLNPDGLSKNQRVNGRGVDLNRNYPSSNWSSEYKEPRYYPGPHPGSEPEIQAFVELIKAYKPPLLIHCHSWNPCVVLTGEPGHWAAKHLCDSSGYELVDNIGYPTPGSLSHFGWSDMKIPVICIEAEERLNSCEVWPKFSGGFANIFLSKKPTTAAG